MAVLPYKDSSQNKKRQVAQMFDNIAHRYDFLNHLLSFHIDKIWRKNAVRKLQALSPQFILDVATGTGDFALAALRLHPQQITGVDISEGMLGIAKAKIARKQLSHQIGFELADSENLPFPDQQFDAVTVGFGVRNFESLEKGLQEIFRVLRNGGQLVVLEFSKPQKAPFRQIYHFYFRRILPLIGRMISKDPSAYTYLPDSVDAFPDGHNFLHILRQIGFTDCRNYPQTFGIATIYTGIRPAQQNREATQ